MSAKQTSDRSIKAAIQAMAGTFGQDVVRINVAQVVLINEAQSTCTVRIKGVNQSVDVPNVNLQTGVCDGLQIIPVVGSDVLVITSTYNQSYIIQYSDVDKFYLQVGDSEVTINNDGSMQLNDGSYDGLVKVQELTQKLNDLENDVNNLKNILQTVLTTTVNEPGNGAPSAFQIAMNAALASYYGQQLTPTQQSDIENNLITHGTI
jgi:hypothetical protein